MFRGSPRSTHLTGSTYGLDSMVDSHGIARGNAKLINPSQRDDELQKPTWLRSILAQNGERRIYLGEALVTEVFLHVATNLDPSIADDAPQILCINGRYGSGKTATVHESLQRIGCQMVRIQASELESPHAGVPAQLIRARYFEASEGQKKKQSVHALVIEDIHQAFGIDVNTYKTINTQLAVSELMSICDFPLRVGGVDTERVPIITTSNDLTRVDGALTRPGRMRVFALELSPTDRARIAVHILRGLATPTQVAALVLKHPEWQMATIRQLKALLLRGNFNQRYAGKAAHDVLRELIVENRPHGSAIASQRTVSQNDLEEAVASLSDEAHAKRDFTGADGRSPMPASPPDERTSRRDPNSGANRSSASDVVPGAAQHDGPEYQV